MPITYIITKDNTTDKIGELDAEIFDEVFQKDTLPTILNDHPNFIKWVNMVYGNGIHKKPEYAFADCFGTWLVFKIGEKGVSRSVEFANIFENHYKEESMDSAIGFNALVEFIQQDWNNDEKQFVETNHVRKIIEKSVKKVKKIVKKARKMKDAKRPAGEFKINTKEEE